MPILIREAKVSDIPTLQKIHGYLHDDNAQYDTFLDLNWPNDARGQKYFQTIIRSRQSIAYIAEQHGVSVGYIAGGKKDMSYRTVPVAEITSMVVHPQYQSQGIGKMLVDQFKVWAKKKGYNKIYVIAYYANKRAIAFYQSCGGKPLDIALEMTL